MLTKKQQAVIDNLKKVEGFNNFDPEQTIEVLTKHSKLWKDGIYDPEDDSTLYLYPYRGMREKLEIAMLKEMDADEVDYCKLQDYSKPPDYSKPSPNFYPILATGGLRIWWD